MRKVRLKTVRKYLTIIWDGLNHSVLNKDISLPKYIREYLVANSYISAPKHGRTFLLTALIDPETLSVKKSALETENDELRARVYELESLVIQYKRVLEQRRSDRIALIKTRIMEGFYDIPSNIPKSKNIVEVHHDFLESQFKDNAELWALWNARQAAQQQEAPIDLDRITEKIDRLIALSKNNAEASEGKSALAKAKALIEEHSLQSLYVDL